MCSIHSLQHVFDCAKDLLNAQFFREMKTDSWLNSIDVYTGNRAPRKLFAIYM